MTAQSIEGQGGIVLADIHNAAVGHQSQLDQRLETVADAQHQAIAVVQQVSHSVRNPGAAEHGGDKFTGTVRLVAAGEAAGKHNHLGTADGFLHAADSFLDAGGGQVLNHQHLRLSTGPLKTAGGIVFAVGAGEHRDKDTGLGRADRWRLRIPLDVQRHLHCHVRLLRRIHRENGIQRG